MADGTKIEWSDATWNPITGCTVHSAGCTNCYAMRFAGTRGKNLKSRIGLTRPSKAGPVWTGEVRFNEDWLLQPLRWKEPRRIFVNAHGDTFHENVPDEWIDRIFAVMALCPQHQFQVLTKRSARMSRYVISMVSGERSIWAEGREIIPGSPAIAKLISEFGWSRFGHAPRKPLPNVWLGVSVEDQRAADERIPDLLATPAAVRWLSCEPLLGAVDLKWSLYLDQADPEHRTSIDWVVVGGESGPKARPMHPEWARSLRDQCAAAGVPFLFKQWGQWVPGESISHQHVMRRAEAGATWFDNKWSFEEYTPRMAEELHCDDAPDLWRVGKRNATRLLDGVLHDGFPA